jgi:hypothetical protein
VPPSTTEYEDTKNYHSNETKKCLGPIWTTNLLLLLSN